MLEEIRIQNMALVKDQSLIFSPHINLITGETGAGKTIIVNALSLLSGARASSEMVGSFAEEAVLEAKITKSVYTSVDRILSDMGITPGEEIIIRRIISKDGKSRAYINGSIVTLQSLAKISSHFITISGQFENQKLLKPENQMLILDDYIGLTEDRADLNRLIESYGNILQELKNQKQKYEKLAKLNDMMTYAIQEIEASNLKPGEEKELSQEKERLKHVSEIKYSLQEALRLLSFDKDSVDSKIANIIKMLVKIVPYDPKLSKFVDSLTSIKNQLEDVIWDLKNFETNVEADPKRLEYCIERLHLVNSLTKKYGGSIEDVLAYKESLIQKQMELEELRQVIKRLEVDLNLLRGKCLSKAKELSYRRHFGVKEFQEAVMGELKGLNMPWVQFQVDLKEKESPDGEGLGWLLNGLEEVEFLISPNLGEPPRPVSKTASGGELSRIILALKGILVKCQPVETIVFDEVDQGISGVTAALVADKLKRLASTQQLIIITHLPQIASLPGTHLLVEKLERDGKTETVIRGLTEEERVLEVTRLLAGNKPTEAAITRAKEMLGLTDKP